MGQDTTNDPPFPGANRNLQVRGLLRWRSRLDTNNTNNQTTQHVRADGDAELYGCWCCLCPVVNDGVEGLGLVGFDLRQEKGVRW